MNHLAFFGLTDDPFRLTPDRDFFFPSANHTALSEVVRYGLQQGEGFIIATGEVGTGKTMLLRFLLNDLDDEYETALILSPHLTPKEIMLAILKDIDIVDQVENQAGMENLLRLLNQYLFELSQKEKRLVIIIDEAQNLPDESIEQLRLLSNFESDKRKLLQIIMVGQPELKAKIEQPKLRQLLQRVAIFETLQPLTKKEMGNYVQFRLNRAGRNDLQINWRAAHILWRYTKGVPRMINKVMSRALIMAYADHKQLIDSKTMREAASSLNFYNNISYLNNSVRSWLVAGGCIAIILAWIVSKNTAFIKALL